MSENLKSWSFSSLNQYKTCPRQYYEVRVKKLFVQDKNEQALYGERAHKVLELAVKVDQPVTAEFKHLQPVVNTVKSTKAGLIEVENRLAVDINKDPVPFESENAWCRGVVDWLGNNNSVAVALDYKTGKRKLTDQLRLMALLVFANYPNVDTVYTGFVWLALNNKVDSEVFEREEIDRLWGTFEQDLSNLNWSHTMGVWPEKPNGLCKKYCPVTTCKFNGGYRRT